MQYPNWWLMAVMPRTPSLQPSCHPAYLFLLLHSARQWHIDGEVLTVHLSKGIGWLRLMGATHDMFMTKSEWTQ
jgi:hypothetical protein